ncbi:MAG: IS1595 family transposase, partial [Paludibacteraceae bacterium]|nr:IS1595 family transposase [Paludibacteraceae bacterium]
FFVSNTRGISSYQLARHIGTTQFTAWRLLTKLRSAIKYEVQLSGNIVLDELYLGGDFRWKPLHKKLPPNIYANYRDYTTAQLKNFIQEYSAQVKMPTLGIVGTDRILFRRRSVTLRACIDNAVSKANVKAIVNPFVKDPTRLITDGSSLYPSLAKSWKVPHSVCDHGSYIYQSTDGYSSSCVEQLFSQVRRMFSGTYTFASRKYLQGYLDECALRYNMRGYSNSERFRIFSRLVFW